MKWFAHLPVRVCAVWLLFIASGSGQLPSPQGANAPKPTVNSVKFGNVKGLTPDEAFEILALDDKRWHVEDGVLEGRVSAASGEGEFFTRKPFTASDFGFGFSVRSKWYQGVVLMVDDLKLVVSRGHWGNTATLVSLNGVEKRSPGEVVAPNEYHAVEIHYSQGEATVFYDGTTIARTRFHKHSSNPKFRVGFIGYDGDYKIKDLFLITKQAGGS